MKRKEIIRLIKIMMLDIEQDQSAAGFDAGWDAGAYAAYANVIIMLKEDY